MSLLTKMQFKLDNLFNQITRLIPSASGKMLYNKWVLYFIFIVGIYDIIHFYQRGNTMAVAIFFIVAFLTSFFSKNMIVVIVSAIAVSHIVAYGNKMSEGFEEGIPEDEEENEAFEEGIEEEDAVEEDTTAVAEPKKKKKVSVEEPESFVDTNDNGTAKLLSDMNKLLKKTEDIVASTKQEGFDSLSNNKFALYQ